MSDFTPAQLEFVIAVQKFVHSSQKAITKLTTDLITLDERVNCLEAGIEDMLLSVEN